VLGDDPALLEAALFSRGLVRRFYDERRLLLPADEAELLRSWIDVPFRLLRVDGFREEAGVLIFTDVVTGASEAAHWDGPDAFFPIGALLGCYLVPNGMAQALLAWSTVSEDDVDEVIRRLAAGDDLALVRTRYKRARDLFDATNVVSE
jgi:hypothetical protein